MKLSHIKEARTHQKPARDPHDEAIARVAQALEVSGVDYDVDSDHFSFRASVKDLQKIVKTFNRKFGKPVEDHPLLNHIRWSTHVNGRSKVENGFIVGEEDFKIYVNKAQSMTDGGTWHRIEVF